MRFSKVILVGSSKIACDCMRYLCTIVDKDKLRVLETQKSSLSMLSRICQKEGIPYSMYTERIVIEKNLLEEIKDEKCLIISANNRFIFTPDIINASDTEIINFHYALLPAYRGMNIPTWVIFNGEKQTGITWHFVTEQIDHGRIIEQRVIPIEENTTAFDIARQGMVLGIQAFQAFIADLLIKELPGTEVIYSETEQIYYNSKLPMNGRLDLNLPIKTILRLLRSFDYGGMELIPKLRVEYLDIEYIIDRYQVRRIERVERHRYMSEKNKLIIQEEETEIELTLI